MKYLVLLRELYEPDNNTPSDKIYTKVVETNDIEKYLYVEEEKLYQEIHAEEKECLDVILRARPLEDINDYTLMEEIW